MNLTDLPKLLQQQWFLYALALAVGFPLTILVLGELIHRYRKRGKIGLRDTIDRAQSGGSYLGGFTLL